MPCQNSTVTCIVSSLALIRSFSYILTTICCFTRFSVTLNIKATTVTPSLVNHVLWHSSHDTDRPGMSSCSTVFDNFELQTLIKPIHHSLKTSLTPELDPHNRFRSLPLVLMSISTMIKDDLGCSAAKLWLVLHCDCPEILFARIITTHQHSAKLWRLNSRQPCPN